MVYADLCGGEPDLPAVGPPDEPFRGRERCRDGPLATGPIHDGDGSSVVSPDGMVEKGDELPIRRDPRLADVAVGLVKDPSDRKLKPVLALDLADDRQLLTVGRPIGPLHVFQNLPRSRAAGYRHTGECPRPRKCMEVPIGE